MNLIFKIAWRNLFRHKGKSIIIGMIIFLGALIMTAGNAVISGMDEGLQHNIVDRFSGDIVLIATNQKNESVIAGGMMEATESFNNYTNVKRILSEQNYIKSFLPVCRGMTTILNEQGDMGFSYILGVDIDSYQAMFYSNLILVEGKMFSGTNKAALVTSGARKELYNSMDLWVLPVGGKMIESNLSPEAKSNITSLNYMSNVVLMGMSSDGSQRDIRLPVEGIVKYAYLDNFWQGYSIIDLESFRECFGYQTASEGSVDISKDSNNILNQDTENLDEMFGSDVFVDSSDVSMGGRTADTIVVKKTDAALSDPELGAYNIVFVKLKDSRMLEPSLKALNATLSNAQAPVKAISWKKASGTIGDMASLIKVVLNVFVVFLYFVAAIIIMNTLSMSALERTNEIGMMRAVGASKSFIGNMFISETALLTLVFGVMGMIVGGVATQIVGALHLTPGNNDALQILFGGDVFSPILTIADIIIGVIELGIATALAMLYPIKVARKITPLEAISRD